MCRNLDVLSQEEYLPFFASRGLSLNDERYDGLPVLGVVLELLAVVAVLAQGPDGHLESSGEAEQTG